MAKIFLSLKDNELAAKIIEALNETKHQAEAVQAFEPNVSLTQIANQIVELNADVVIIDYWPEDAFSVKLMQTVADEMTRPAFIFLENQTSPPTDREQFMMAFNEGAFAILPPDFSLPALLNYIERSLSGPGRLRFKAQNPAQSEEAILALEEELGQTRTKSTNFQKLIAHLLAGSALDRRVLLISDSIYQLELLKKILTEHNFQVLTAQNSDDALAIATGERPRLIVCDFELGGQTGIELCQAIKFTHKVIPCYFVICTANQAKFSQAMTPGNGVDDCVLKPSGQSQHDAIDFVSRVALGLLI